MTPDKDAQTLCDFGLTLNQAKVYLAALQLGSACVGKISKEAGIRREDVYRILPLLEKLGLVEKTLGTPTRVKARPLEKALSVLMNNQRTKLSRMKTTKEELLKKYQKTHRGPNLAEEENQFVLLSERELILNKIELMMKKATEQVDIISTSENFFRYLPTYAKDMQKAISKDAKVQARVILDLERSKDSIERIHQKEKTIPPWAPVRIRYSYDSLNPLVIVDGKEVLTGTSVKQVLGVFGEYPYLWSTNQTLARLLQKSFDEQWHLSASSGTVTTELVPDKIKAFAEQLRPMDYVMFTYDAQEAKHNVLFNYIEAGLEKREVAAYITSEESPNEVRDAMKRFGIDVERHEKNGALRIFNYDEIYLINGEYSFSAIADRWKKLYDEAMSKGFKGLRAAGEMGCFFKHNVLTELIEYEHTAHRTVESPIIGICAYKTDMFNQAKDPINLYNELVRAHRIVLFTSTDKSITKYEIRGT